MHMRVAAVVLDAPDVDDDISVGRKASAAWAQIVVSSSAGVGIGPKQVKSVRDGLDDTPGGFQALASLAM